MDVIGKLVAYSVTQQGVDEHHLPFKDFVIYPSFQSGYNVAKTPFIVDNNTLNLKLKMVDGLYIQQYNSVVYFENGDYIRTNGANHALQSGILKVTYSPNTSLPSDHTSLINNFNTNNPNKTIIISPEQNTSCQPTNKVYVCILDISEPQHIELALKGSVISEYEIIGLTNGLHILNGNYTVSNTDGLCAKSLVVLGPGKYLVIIREVSSTSNATTFYWKNANDNQWYRFDEAQPGHVYCWNVDNATLSSTDFIKSTSVNFDDFEVLISSNISSDGYYDITFLDGYLYINNEKIKPLYTNLPVILNESLYVENSSIAILCDDDDKVYGFFVLCENQEKGVIQFDKLKLLINTLKFINNVSVRFGEDPSNWQASFSSSIYYPPGTELAFFGFTFLIKSVSQQPSNMYNYIAVPTFVLTELLTHGYVNDLGAFKRIYNTDPYEWESQEDLFVASQNIARTKSNNTLPTPFEKSFDRFVDIEWSIEPQRASLVQLYNNTQVLMIPWVADNTVKWITADDLLVKYGLKQLDYVPPSELSDIEFLTPFELTSDFLISFNEIGHNDGKMKFFVSNKYKKAVTMYECPNKILALSECSPNDIYLDIGFSIAAFDGLDYPTVRFTYNYNIDFDYITRINLHNQPEPQDSSGMALYSNNKNNYWFEYVTFNISSSSEENTKFNKLIRTFLRSLIFVANPIITFDSNQIYTDSYIPYPVSPFNYTVYLRPIKVEHPIDPDYEIKWIPTQQQYVLYDISLINTLPDVVWTGAYGSVVRVPTIQQNDPFLNKQIVQQGFFVNNINLGNNITPFSLLSVETKTNMPILADDVIRQYLQDISNMPESIKYKVYMMPQFEKSLHQYGITLEQALTNATTKFDKILDIDLSNLISSNDVDIHIYNSDGSLYLILSADGLKINDSTYVIVCYNLSSEKINLSTDEIYLREIHITPPKDRCEANIILLFGNAIYFITLRIFKSPPFLVFPYIYKVGEFDRNNKLTTDYSIVSVPGYTNLINHVKNMIDKSITVTWEGKQDEFVEIFDKLLPWRVVKCGDEYYVVNNLSIEVVGDYIRVVCQLDNRIRFFEKWNKIVTDISPELCKFEIYPRIPNNHHPIPRIYAFSNRIEKLKEYLTNLLKYTYIDDVDDINIDDYITIIDPLIVNQP